jgi:hypothetical protein
MMQFAVDCRGYDELSSRIGMNHPVAQTRDGVAM